ncbi:hypothetical protein CHARACLAT_025272 [Characodon lateralis]|uniref:Uncharacterized protein n=1 Tax=Characodon lateralis TaxID=208331 RepID=A0ABU7CRL2_9TELE|nr:hypothetical protein [Characodon lateralis]
MKTGFCSLSGLDLANSGDEIHFIDGIDPSHDMKTRPPAPLRPPVLWKGAEGEEGVSLLETGAAAVVPLESK